MLRNLLFAIFILSVCFTKAQHYTQGIPVDTVLYSGVYSSTGGSCSSSENPDIILANNLAIYIDGLQFMMIVDSVIFAGPPQFSPVHVGDTIILDAAHSVYYTPAPVTFYFRLKLVGTPLTAGQHFPCSLEYTQCTCNCYHLMIMSSTVDISQCTVDLAQGVNETTKQPSLKLYPNPAINQLLVSGIHQQTTIKLFNNFGQLVLEQSTDHDISLYTEALAAGMYTLVTSSNEADSSIIKKIMINK